MDLSDFELNPVLSHRFSVTLMSGELIPNVLDFRFQKVSGIRQQVELETVAHGGENLFESRLPKALRQDNLVLERGYATLSPLRHDLKTVFQSFEFSPAPVLVVLYDKLPLIDEVGPVASWLFRKAYPVKWDIAEFDAMSNQVLIESMELTHSGIQTIGL